MYSLFIEDFSVKVLIEFIRLFAVGRYITVIITAHEISISEDTSGVYFRSATLEITANTTSTHKDMIFMAINRKPTSLTQTKNSPAALPLSELSQVPQAQ